MLRTFTRPAAALAMLLAAACSKVTPHNYDRVETGMSPQQVHEILGRPDEVGGGTLANFEVRSEVWTSRRHRIEITFLNGKLMRKWIGTPEETAEASSQ